MTQEKEIQELRQALLKANEDIEKLSNVKSDFISIISHELRTPLTSIKESISLVSDGIAGPISESQRKFLGIAKNNIDRLSSVIIDILDFSKLDSGRITMHKRKINVNNVIKDVYDGVKTSIDKKGLMFSLELSNEIGLTWLDPDRISQALKNLISNAIKFNKVNGKIKISSAKELMDGREVIKVSVEDTGIGIPKKDLPNLFKAFEPLDTSMTRRHRGIGIGLAVCKRIVQFHGGVIWVESEEDRGSRFNFTMPIYKKDDEFNFLLDEAIERARYNDIKLALIIFGIEDKKDANEENLSELEDRIKSSVRGPEDKVVRFKGGHLIAVIAGTDEDGAKKIMQRIKRKIEIALNFGISIYPDSSQTKDNLIKEAEKGLRSKKFTL